MELSHISVNQKKVPLEISFELDETIKKYISVFKLRLIFSRFPETKQILQDIEEIKILNHTIVEGNEGNFEIPITTNIENDYFNMAWDIESLKKHLVLNPKQAFSIPINQLHRNDNKNDIDPKKIDTLMKEFPNYKFPIIITDYTKGNMVIDGNHRCFLNAQYKINQIKSIRLNIEEVYPFIFYLQHKKLFALHYNIHSINTYCNSHDSKSFLLIINDEFVTVKKRRFIFF